MWWFWKKKPIPERVIKPKEKPDPLKRIAGIPYGKFEDDLGNEFWQYDEMEYNPKNNRILINGKWYTGGDKIILENYGSKQASS